ncbi:MAG TPA: GAF domain-containing protein, partial [Candidatus Methylomirabilis sp.]|nr:GAF domain-containing protein [Candidatus Methylomirabilis sp.]
MTTPLRVLILEDSPTEAALMLDHLREAGYSPEWRRVETEADFRAHLEPTLDLILADYTLPDFTARQALHLLRERAQDIPVIVVTGTVSEDMALECLRLGASDYLLKDRLARLGEAVRTALTQRTLRRERATAEAARHESEARARFLADVLERSSQAFGVGYPDGRMDICNAAFCTLVGYSEAELRALDWSRDLTPPEWRAVEAERLADLHRTGRPVRYEKEYLRKDGTRVPVELLLHPVREGAEASPYYFAFVTDLTDRKRAELDLATRTRQLEAVRAVSDEIARELDLARVLELISRRAADLVGRGAVKVFLWEEPAQLLVQRAWSGAEDPALARLTIRLGEGLAGQVAERREGMIVNDYQAWPFAHPQVLERSNVTAALAEPLLYRGRLVGVILLDNRDTGRPFTENDRALLRLFAAPAAIAIENARLHSAAVHQGAELDALLRVTRSVMSGLDLQAILMRIAAAAADIAGTPHVKVILLDKEAEQLRIGALGGMTAGGFPLPMGSGLSGLVATEGEPV